MHTEVYLALTYSRNPRVLLDAFIHTPKTYVSAAAAAAAAAAAWCYC